jgi:hypothetical protein
MPGPIIRTRVNNPERVFLNSSDDPRTVGNQGFNSFICTYDTPILGAAKTMMLRATIPNAQVNIPDYMLEFWYYSLPTATTAPSIASLRCVRLYPSYYQAPAALGTAFTKNRFFSDPADFVTQLNLAAAAGGDNVTYNPYWVAGDITFSYNATTKQITFTGNTAGRFYCPAGWDDTIVTVGGAPNMLMPNFNGVGTTVQPYLAGYTLNLRVGYAMSGLTFGIPGNTATTANTLYADLTNSAYANGTAVPADSYPNLVYSQCVYLYSNLVAGVSLGSSGQHNLLAVVPSNAPQLGVIQYTALTVNMMNKLADTIYAITIEMRDDANQPFTLPDNAQVNIELAFVYE